MLGLGYVLLLLLYLWVAKVIVLATLNWAKRNQKNTRLWPALAAILMISIVFWDVIPVYAILSYRCTNESGFTIFKNLEDWKKENPGVSETLSPLNGKVIKDGNGMHYRLNQRFSWERKTSKEWYIVNKKEEQIIDVETSDVMAKYIDFYTNLANPMIASSTQLRDFKMWLKIESCENNKSRPVQRAFRRFKYLIEYQKEHK